MSSPSFTEAFVIIRQDKHSTPVEVYPYHTKEANYVGASISMCQGLLKQDHVKQSFSRLAREVLPCLKPELADHWLNNDPADLFITKVLEKFPLVFVNQAIENPDDLAAHIRTHKGDDYEFDTHNHGIIINGEMVRRMCIAGTDAKNAQVSNGSDSPELDDFHRFVFQFGRAFTHELGHLFVTMLGNGKADTPPHVFSPTMSKAQDQVGEAGAALEKRIFGGKTGIIHDPDKGKDQPGKLCIVDETGGYEVKIQTVHEFVRYQFSFPLPRGQSIFEGVRSLGSVTGKPLHTWEDDPAERSETRQLLINHGIFSREEWEQKVNDLVAQSPNPKRFGPAFGAVMMRIPNEPALRLEKAS